MPSTDGQGQSIATENKERGFSAAFSVGIRIFQSRWKNRFRYFHFDLNAGSGFNEEVGCIGSPIAFMRVAESLDLHNYFAGFVEKNEGYVKALLNRVEGDPRAFVFRGMNADFVPMIPRIIEACSERLAFAVGSVLIDPNGCGVPLSGLRWLSRVCPRLDFIINWNTMAFKRNRKYSGFDLPELIKALSKKHWLIREPHGVHQFTVLIGRNVKTGDHTKLGFHHLDGKIGQSIFNRCALLKRHWVNLRQGTLFDEPLSDV